VLYGDDWRHDSLSCAGNPVVRTPHVDRLAREGLRFTNNFVTTSICGVSRATLLTGQWMSRHGNLAFAMFKTPWAETYARRAPGARLSGRRARRQVAQRQPFRPLTSTSARSVWRMRHWLPQPNGSPDARDAAERAAMRSSSSARGRPGNRSS
jgi:arylsulfatase